MTADDAAGTGTGAKSGVGAAESGSADVDPLEESEDGDWSRSTSIAAVAVLVGLVALVAGVAYVYLTGQVEQTFGALEAAVETATGWPGLVIIFVYSLLIAVVLPLPSEIVLVAPLDLGVGGTVTLGVIMLVSGAGKALGSLAAFHVGQEAKESGPVIRWLRRSRFDVVEYSENKTVQLAQKFGYVGLALALCVPGFPDTLSIYAFSVLEEDYVKFAAATFAGSVGRLLVWTLGAEATLALLPKLLVV